VKMEKEIVMKRFFAVVVVFLFLCASVGILWAADDSWTKENRWGRWDKGGKKDQVGVLNEMTQAISLNAFKMIKTGKVYDLETLRFKGMPVWPGHSGWDILPYASPHGRQTMLSEKEVYGSAYNWYHEGGWLDHKINKYHVGLNSEIYIGPLHVGTHMDSLSHLTVGKDNHWYNGFNEANDWSNYGPLKADNSNVPPVVLRGVLLDIPGYKGVEHLESGYGVSKADIIGCAEWEGIEIKRGDAVLIRTGIDWPGMKLAGGAGPTLEAAKYLVGTKDIFLIGDDQAAFENFPPDAPSSFPGHVHPVHHYLLIQNGVHLIEMVRMEEIAKDKVYEFCFIMLPNKIKGATGMMVRPIAVK
jgi:kynurenine formamidase